MRTRMAWLAACLLASASPVAGALAQADVITQRREGLKRMGAHLEAMKPVADGTGEPRATVQRIDDMLVWFRGFPALFPPGSDRGDTKARPEVFSDRAGFERANANAIQRLEAIRVVAAANDTSGFSSQFGSLGQQACGTCHRGYRAR